MKFIKRTDLFLILKYLGSVMIGIGVVVMIPIIIALIYKEHYYILNYLLPGLLSISLGYIFKNKFKSEENLQVKHTMILAAIAWLWACFIGSLPMMMYLHIPFIDAFFENMSAWTTTGLSIFPDVEVLPKSILFLRSLEQWVGGLGIVILVIGVMVKAGSNASLLYESESRNERIRPSIVHTVKIIWLIYITFTLIGIILYGIAGMSLFDAVNHTFTALATGGMSTKNLNIGHYHSIYINLITIFLMILGGISFFAHYEMFTGKIKNALKNKAMQATIILIFTFTIFNTLITKIPFLDALFYMTSAITATGFSLETTAQFQVWPQVTLFLLIILMVVGAGEGSTAGAIKINKVLKVLKGIKNLILRSSLPKNAVIIDGREFKSSKNEEIRKASIYVCLYIIVLIIGTLILTAYTNNFLFSLFEVASAQGNVGITTGITQASLNIVPKTVLIIQMWIGRLEIVPILLLIKSIINSVKFSITT